MTESTTAAANSNQTELIHDEASQQQVEIDREKYYKIINELKDKGRRLRSDQVQPNFSDRPEWFDEALFENAKSVYARHFMAVNFAHLSGLLLLVRVYSIFRTLRRTGKSDTVADIFNRYYQTIIHVKKWYEGDIFEKNSDAYRSLLIVRGMHNKVSASSNIGGNSKAPPTSSNKQPETTPKLESVFDEQYRSLEATHKYTHLSQYDIMITQFAFVGFIVTRAKSVGLIEDFNEHDLKSLLHFWRVIGYYLGASELYNLCSRKLEDITGFCEAITDIEYKQSIKENPISSPPGIMSINIVRSVKFIPMLTIYGIHKYLYDLLGIQEPEFVSERVSGYARLSNTLINLVMTNLLAYKALRMFNNGLTRLSLFLVGKIQNWFSDRLKSKYGQELRPL